MQTRVKVGQLVEYKDSWICWIEAYWPSNNNTHLLCMIKAAYTKARILTVSESTNKTMLYIRFIYCYVELSLNVYECWQEMPTSILVFL